MPAAAAKIVISIHAPRTGSDEIPGGLPAVVDISIHAPRTGSDALQRTIASAGLHFNPRSPHGERLNLVHAPAALQNFNPRSPHGERRRGGQGGQQTIQISIHAPRTGSDVSRSAFGWATGAFQSTLPARGATSRKHANSARASNFNPRSPHGERRRKESTMTKDEVFQSTLPARGATQVFCVLSASHCISIHAPRTGSDFADWRGRVPPEHFNPRSPHGERHTSCTFSRPAFSISIHAPRTGSDVLMPGKMLRLIYFNPRSPHGERPARSGMYHAPQ